MQIFENYRFRNGYFLNALLMGVCLVTSLIYLFLTYRRITLKSP